MQSEIINLLEDLVKSLNYELWGYKYIAEEIPILKVYIDKPLGLTIEDCVTVTKQLKALLNVESIFNLRLEVSSPGVPRSLFKPEQYLRYINHTVKIKLKEPCSLTNNYSISGILREVREQDILLETSENFIVILFSKIFQATLVN